MRTRYKPAATYNPRGGGLNTVTFDHGERGGCEHDGGGGGGGGAATVR
jgi:hypothetical protein